MQGLKLYGYIACPYVQRIRYALEYRRIPYLYEEVDILKHKQKEPQYLKINPFAKVPSLYIPSGESLFESLPLLEYLENEYGGIMPQNNARKAQQRIWINYFDQNVLSKFWTILSHYKKRDKASMDSITKPVFENLITFTKNSGITETLKNNPKGFYEGGQQLTFADFVLIPSLRALDIFYRRLNEDDQFSKHSQDEHFKALLQYYSNGLAEQNFQNITTKLSTFPPQSNNYLIYEMGFNHPGKFNYEEFALKYQYTKYNY